MLGPSETLEAAPDHDGQPVTQRLTLLHGVRGQDYRGSGLPNVVDRLPDLPPGGGIHPGGGLVQQHHLWPSDECQGHVQLPLVTSGVLTTRPMTCDDNKSFDVIRTLPIEILSEVNKLRKLLNLPVDEVIL